MHYTAGAIIERDGKYLLIDRELPPFGWAGVAGHLANGEDPDDAIVRKVREEVNLDVVNAQKILTEEVPWNTCREGTDCHLWHMYQCETRGEVRIALEGAKAHDWFSKERIAELKLELVWDYWLKKLGIIE